MSWHVTHLQMEAGPSHKFLLLSDRNPHGAFLALGYLFPSVLNLWQVSKGAPCPVKAPSHSQKCNMAIFLRHSHGRNTCSLLLTHPLVRQNVLPRCQRLWIESCCWEEACTLQLSCRSWNIWEWNLKQTVSQVILGWKEPQEVTHMCLRQTLSVLTELVHLAEDN